MIQRYLTNRSDWESKVANCYSVVLRMPNYSGPCLKLRRSSDNAEQDIGFDSEIIDVAEISSFLGADNGFVTTWYDQSGGGFHATQTTANSQPQLMLSQLNSLPILRFDGSNDHLFHGLFNANPTSLHVFSAVKKNDTGTARLIWQHRDTPTQLVQIGYDSIGANPTQPLFGDARGSLNNLVRVSTMAKSHLDWNIFNYLFNKIGQQRLTVDTTIVTNNAFLNNSETINSSLNIIGRLYAGDFTNMDLAELLICKEGLPSYQSDTIQNAINTTFEIY